MYGLGLSGRLSIGGNGEAEGFIEHKQAFFESVACVTSFLLLRLAWFHDLAKKLVVYSRA